MATKKKFDAVAESRKWRTATGKKLSLMDEGERLAYLNQDVAGKLQALRTNAATSKARRPRKAVRKRKVEA
jgi:nitrogen fixation protein FixH